MVDTAPRQIGSGGDKVSRTMGGGWVRSVGGLPRRWCLGNTDDAVVADDAAVTDQAVCSHDAG